MENYKKPAASRLTKVRVTGLLLAIFCLVCAWSAEATAPRITPKMFGEEKNADIVGYQLAASSEVAAKPMGELVLAIVTEAFKAAGKTPTVDVLPSRQLASYALTNNEALALIGSLQDLTAKDKDQYSVVTFYLKGEATGEEPVALIFGKKNEHANELYVAFNEGMQKIIENGKYLEILEKYHGQGHVPADYAKRLKRQNPSWK